ncbi:glycosyltransferase [Nibribacter ruber]|uniref:Glycosyltransferase n=1 Tax=Nibribacter ruber TaxID=2698458 RepID=A0A6P1NUY5_9BACT|nr:glycosyltransferase family 2 protein [Nibribacter ruber]QHL86144.1 glycosyltransferase [Nibribacter ruber]
MTLVSLSCYILTHNSQEYLAQVLEPLQGVVDDLVIIDSGSKDNTQAIAEQFKARFIHRPLDNFKNQRNFALDQCQHTWVLSLDSDEVPDSSFVQALQAFKATAASTDIQGFKIERKWIVMGQEVQTFYPILCPDFPLRLFRKDVVNFNERSNMVHETPSGHTKEGTLDGFVRHYTFNKVEDLYRKLNLYTSIAAQDMAARGKTASWDKIIFSPMAAWIKWYLIKQGFRDGAVGWVLGQYAYDYTLQKYLKLRFDLKRK